MGSGLGVDWQLFQGETFQAWDGMSKGSEAETSLAEAVTGAHNVLCYSSSISSASRGGDHR